MKKHLLIAILIFISVFSVVFGFQQKMQADKYKKMAEENERLAREQAYQMQKQLERAVENLRAAEAMALARRNETPNKVSKQ